MLCIIFCCCLLIRYLTLQVGDEFRMWMTTGWYGSFGIAVDAKYRIKQFNCNENLPDLNIMEISGLTINYKIKAIFDVCGVPLSDTCIKVNFGRFLPPVSIKYIENCIYNNVVLLHGRGRRCRSQQKWP